MRCASVLSLVATIFVVPCSVSPVPCVFTDYNRKKLAYCGTDHTDRKLDFIPAISQNISHINMQGQPLKQLPYNGFRNLSSQSSISDISLAQCQISYVAAGALVNLHNLAVIDLSDNDINQVDSKLFSETKQIEIIFMANNEIEVVPSGLFQNLILLKRVYLQHNRIHQVESSSFKNTPSLRKINLSYNQIEFMNMSFKDKLDNFTNLSLYGNPWKCNCELGPLYEFLVNINMSNEYPPVCDEPSTLHGRNWSDISRDEFVCRSEVTMSTVDSAMTSAGPVTTTDHGDHMPVTVHNGTRSQQVDTGVPQPPSNQNWIPYAMLVLVLVGVAAVIIGVVSVVRYTRAISNRWRLLGVPTLVEQGSDRLTHARPVDRGTPMRDVHSSAGSAGSE